MDDQNQNPPNQPATSPQTNNPQLISRAEKVLQPTEAILQEAQSQPDVAPTATLPPAPQPAQPVPVPPQPQTSYSQVNPVPNKDEVPIGVSASSLGLNTPHSGGIEWGGLLKKALIIIVALAVIGGGGLLAKNLLSNLNTKTLTKGGYTYTFKYYKKAAMVKLNDGSDAYKYLDNSTGGVGPTTMPIVTDCSQVGRSWTEAFTAKVYGAEQPVCTASTGNFQVYTMIFSALNKHHLFIVTYNNDPQSSPYSTLKTIFGSVTVSQ